MMSPRSKNHAKNLIPLFFFRGFPAVSWGFGTYVQQMDLQTWARIHQYVVWWPRVLGKWQGKLIMRSCKKGIWPLNAVTLVHRDECQPFPNKIGEFPQQKSPETFLCQPPEAGTWKWEVVSTPVMIFRKFRGEFGGWPCLPFTWKTCADVTRGCQVFLFAFRARHRTYDISVGAWLGYKMPAEWLSRTRDQQCGDVSRI